MIHARDDYNRIQDPGLQDPTLLGDGCSPIAEDEPVFLLRAKDKYFIPMLTEYVKLLTSDEDFDVTTLSLISPHMVRAVSWQRNHGTKSPDAPRPKDET